MRRHLVRWAIVAALVAVAGAMPGGGPQRIELRDVPEALSFFNVGEPDVPAETRRDSRS